MVGANVPDEPLYGPTPADALVGKAGRPRPRKEGKGGKKKNHLDEGQSSRTSCGWLFDGKKLAVHSY